MAYTDDDLRVVIRGNLPGGEIWANTWAVKDLGDFPSQDLADAFHAFYGALAGIWANTTTATDITITRLSTNEELGASWTTVTGDDTSPSAMPNECAVRLSLSAPDNVRGGPFLTGFSVATCADDGNFAASNQSEVGGAFDTLCTDLTLIDHALCINKTQDEELVFVTQGRIGQVFDVIRRRRNKLSENYFVVPVEAP